MCHFVTATLPAGVDLDAAAAVFEAHKCALAVVDNPHMVLPAGDVYVSTTSGPCDCGTPLGSKPEADGPPADSELQRLRKKGWSEAKIRRWQAQKSEVVARNTRNSDDRARTPEANEWLALITAMLRLGPRFGLLIHWYKGGVATERLDPAKERIALADLDAERLLRLSQDVLYEFHR